MKNLAKIKKRLKLSQPVFTREFRGVNSILMSDPEEIEGVSVPLTVSFGIPSLQFLFETKAITTLLLRYSKTFQESKNNLKGNNAAAAKIIAELSENIVGNEVEQAKQIKTILQIGKEFVVAKSINGWYENKADAFKIVFLDTEDEVNEFNEDDANLDTLAVWTEHLTELELLDISTHLMSTTETPDIPEIPIIDSASILENPTDEGGEGVIVADSVPADKVARFPRDVRSLAMADVPKSGGAEVGDSGNSPAV